LRFEGVAAEAEARDAYFGLTPAQESVRREDHSAAAEPSTGSPGPPIALSNVRPLTIA
jgi:hypothetical protein